MCKSIIGALSIIAIATVGLSAQTPPPPLPLPDNPAPVVTTTIYQPPPAPAAPIPLPASEAIAPPLGAVSPAPPPLAFAPVYATPYRIWADAEILLWWVKNTPVPAPLATLGDPGTNAQTVIGQGNTGFGAFTGGRFNLGVWVDPDNRFGLVSNIFWLEGRQNVQTVRSYGDGTPTVGLSFLNAIPGQPGEFIQPLSQAGAFAGGVRVTSTLDLWGAEVNGAYCFTRINGWEFIGLAGFRYLDLRENLYVNSGTTDLTTGDFINLYDQFSTRNQFYGGQIGASVNWQRNRLALSATAKLALGSTHEVVNIQGSSFGSAAGGYFPGGFYAQPSNMGRFTTGQLGVVPSLQLKVSYQLTRSWRLFLGYDFLYWNQVVRPGSQVDRNINLSQSALLGAGVPASPALPMPLFNRSDFWAQGLTLGLEFRF